MSPKSQYVKVYSRVCPVCSQTRPVSSRPCSVTMKKPLFVSCPVDPAPFLCYKSIKKKFSPLSNFWLIWLKSRLLCPKAYRTVSENGNFGGCLWHSPITYPLLFLKIWSLVPHGAGSGDNTIRAHYPSSWRWLCPSGNIFVPTVLFT